MFQLPNELLHQYHCTISIIHTISISSKGSLSWCLEASFLENLRLSLRYESVCICLEVQCKKGTKNSPPKINCTLIEMSSPSKIKGRKGNWLLVQRRSNDTLQIFVPKGYTFVLDHLMSKDPDDLFQKCIINYSRNPTHNHLKWTIIYKQLILSFTN